jgi:hypothetical protein
MDKMIQQGEWNQYRHRSVDLTEDEDRLIYTWRISLRASYPCGATGMV